MSAQITEKLDKLAMHLMMIDESLKDLLQTSEASTISDEIKALLASTEHTQLTAIFDGVSQLFEKFLLDSSGGTGPDAIRLANEGINIVKDVLGGTSTIEDVKDKLDSLAGEFKSIFEVEIAIAASAAEPATEKTEAPKKVEEEGGSKRTELVLLDENDVEIFDGFLEESSDSLSKVEDYLITLEEEPKNMEIINSLFRIFHSLKGAAGFLGMTEINFLCHQTENMLDQARKSMLSIDAEVIDILLASKDLLEKGLNFLHDLLSRGREQLPNFHGECDPLEVQPIVELIDRKLYLASMEHDSDAESPKIGQILVEQKAISPEKLEAALTQKSKPVGEVLVEMGAASRTDVDKAVAAQGAKKKTFKSSSVKVDTAKLNILLDLVGELVISQSIISQNEVLENDTNVRLAKDILEMAKITDGIQDHIMSLRMVPMKQTFGKMNRLVRDLSRKTNKRVTLEVFGEDTEIDKTIVDKLNDPLVHLLRNAVDHGIDPEEDRIAAGKNPEGVVSLSAYHKGGNVIIEIKDDGRGLNLAKLKAKGIEKGLFTEDVEYSDEELIEVIFQPGLSTHAVATDLSGRGVGMDVVRRNVENLGGRVEVQTALGEGSTFLIRLPLTMAIVDGMLVRVGTERYIIPTISINESIRPREDQFTKVVGRGDMLNVRGEMIPLVRLHELFGIENDKKSLTESLVIIVNTGNEKRGLLVDNLLGQQQVVIKNLDKRLQGIAGFSGSSILGDGLVGLILDIGGIFKLAS